MKKIQEESFFLKNDFLKEEFLTAIKNSKPYIVSKINFIKRNFDFNTGEFSFFIKDRDNEIEISFHNDDINKFWNFLNEAVKSNEALILHLFYYGLETIILTDFINKADIRFVVLTTNDLYRKERRGEILKYSYKEAKIELDFRINKRTFVRNFYFELFNLFEDYKNIAFFERPLIDFDFWIKDSSIIKNYIKIKRRKK